MSTALSRSILLWACGIAGSAHAETPWRFAASVDPTLGTLTATACVDGKAPHRLAPVQRALARYLVEARGLDDTSAQRDGDSIIVRTSGARSCVRLRVDLARAAAVSRDVDVALRVGDDLLFTPDLFLWIEDDPPAPIEVRITGPPTHHVSRSWPDGHYPASALAWRTLVAITRRPPRMIERAGRQVKLVQADGALALEPRVLDAWAGGAMRALDSLHGGAPISRLLLVVQPIPVASRPVAFAMAIRGGGATVHALVARDADPAAIVSDWVLTHELSHFALPFIAREDAWLSEGSASYLQNVLRARAGLRTPEAAWEELLAGFDRGREQAGELDLTLTEASREMMARRAFYRVYWSGAALALMTDVALRARGLTLDGALAAGRNAESGRTRRPSAREVVAAIDRYAGRPTLAPLAERWLATRTFPDVAATLEGLGIRQIEGRVLLDPTAPRAALARAIMSPP